MEDKMTQIEAVVYILSKHGNNAVVLAVEDDCIFWIYRGEKEENFRIERINYV